MKSLGGKVVVVDGGGSLVGRAVALSLAAAGAQIVVNGPEERSLAETVGEIAYGGGKARHVVGDIAAAAQRALEVFGPPDVLVTTHVDCKLPPEPRAIVIVGAVNLDEIGAMVVQLCASKLGASRITIEA